MPQGTQENSLVGSSGTAFLPVTLKAFDAHFPVSVISVYRYFRRRFSVGRFFSIYRMLSC